jgi:hypothetical protein
VRPKLRCASTTTAVLLVAAIVGGCGSGQIGRADGSETSTDPEPTESGSGAYAVTTVPKGWFMAFAFSWEGSQVDVREATYKSVVDPEDPQTQWKITSGPLNPGDWENMTAGAVGGTRIDVNGHEGYIGVYPWDNDLTRTAVLWHERPDRWVQVDLPSDIGLDAQALAADVRELSAEDFAACNPSCPGVAP